MNAIITKLTEYLTSKSQPLILCESDDAPTTLQNFIKTTPNKELKWNQATITLEENKLIVSGEYTEKWTLTAIKGASVTFSTLTVTIDCTEQESAKSSITAYGTGIAKFAGEVSFEAIIAEKDGYWKITPSANARLTPTKILQIAGELLFPLPDQMRFLNKAVELSKDGLSIIHRFDEKPVYLVECGIEIPTKWELLPGVLALEKVGLSINYGPYSFTLGVIGHIYVSGVDIELECMLQDGSLLSIELSPPEGKKFPSLFDLAKVFMPNPSLDTSGLPDNIGWDQSAFDAGITAVRAEINMSTPTSMKSLVIDGTVTLFDLDFALSFSLPNPTFHGYLCQNKSSSADDFIGKVSSGAKLPGDFTIESMMVMADFGAKSYSFSIALGGQLEMGPIVLEHLYASIAYQNSSAALSFGGRIAIDTVSISISADYSDSSWNLSGGVIADDRLTAKNLLDFLAKIFSIEIDAPESLSTLCLKELSVEYNTGTKNFTFICKGGMTLEGNSVDAEIFVSMEQSETGYTSKYSGKIVVEGIEFALSFIKADGKQLVLGSCQGKENESLSLNNIVSAFSDQASELIPEALSLNFKEVAFSWLKNETESTFLFGVGLDMSFDFSKLPVVGSELSTFSPKLDGLKIGIASKAVIQEDIDFIKEHKSDNPFPANALNSGFFISANLQLSGTPQNLMLGSAAPSDTAKKSTDTSPAQGKVLAPASDNKTAKMFNIDKHLGPVYIRRLGIGFDDSVLSIILDGSLTLSVFSMTLEGFSLGSRLDKFDLTVGLEGLAISCDLSSIKVAGSIRCVKSDDAKVTLALGGSLTITAAKWSFTAIASYIERKNEPPSFFAFLTVRVNIIIDPAFVITGLMGGFGIHRKLVIPTLDEVEFFPFFQFDDEPQNVLSVIEGRAAGKSGTTKEWLVPSTGDFWMAFGLEFMSYGVFTGKLLLAVVFGKKLEITLIGKGDLILPKTGTPYVNIQVLLLAYFCPDDGIVTIEAKLASSSYLLSPDCHLTGGFAVCFWFGKHPNAGEFVLTIGGYHPEFKVPAHYPKADRVGYNWVVSRNLLIKGEAYFALTPDCAMAGVSLEIQFHTGPFRAWFIARANFIVAWHPFSFRGKISVEIGMSLQISIFGFKSTISASLGASLDLWGPPTGGIVSVHILFFSIDIAFGAGSNTGKRYDPLKYSEFAELLPAKEEVITLGISKGLLDTIKVKNDTNEETWIVNPGSIVIFAKSAVPITECLLLTPSTTTLSIRPMDIKNEVVSDFELSFTKEGGSGLTIKESFTVTEESTLVPASLWGDPLQENDRFVQSLRKPSDISEPSSKCVGISLTSITKLGTKVELSKLEEKTIEKNGIFKNDSSSVNKYLPQEGTISDIAKINSSEMVKARNSLLDLLRQSHFENLQTDDMSDLATTAIDVFNGLSQVIR